MQFKPILFSTPMVQALLAGRKTQTRRIMKPQPDPEGDAPVYMPTAPALDWEQYYKQEWKPWNFETAAGESVMMHCPYGKPGDILWVRESFAIIGTNVIRGGDGEIIDETHQYVYMGQKQPHIEKLYKWKPSIHMPQAACRLFLQAKAIRVERLQDITSADALAEGVDHVIDKVTGYCGYDYLHGGYNIMTTPYHGFKSLWKKIHGVESWNANPWLWVVEFEKIDRPANFI